LTLFLLYGIISYKQKRKVSKMETTIEYINLGDTSFVQCTKRIKLTKEIINRICKIGYSNTFVMSKGNDIKNKEIEHLDLIEFEDIGEEADRRFQYSLSVSDHIDLIHIGFSKERLDMDEVFNQYLQNGKI